MISLSGRPSASARCRSIVTCSCGSLAVNVLKSGGRSSGDGVAGAGDRLRRLGEPVDVAA